MSIYQSDSAQEPTGWLVVACPMCGRPPGIDCFTAAGYPCPTHEARKAAAQSAPVDSPPADQLELSTE